MGLVSAVARQVRRDLEMGAHAGWDVAEELEAYGREALVESSRRFDAGTGVPFERFARHRVRGAILDGIAEMGGVPRRLYRRLRFHRTASDLLAGWSSEEVEGLSSAREVREALHTAYLLASEGSGDWLEADLGVDGAPGAALLGKRVRGAVEGLPERERTLVKAHYFEGLSLAAAGRRIGVSRSYATRLQRRALAMLRKRMGLPRRT